MPFSLTSDSLDRLFEFGIMENLNERYCEAIYLTYKFRIKLYRRKQEYIHDFTKNNNMTFSFFSDLFKLYLLANTVIFIGFVSPLIIHHFLVFYSFFRKFCLFTLRKLISYVRNFYSCIFRKFCSYIHNSSKIEEKKPCALARGPGRSSVEMWSIH
jgi:hypothetical protein